MRNTLSARSRAVFASPGRTTVNRLRRRSRRDVLASPVMLSLHPMENVSDDRPARLARRRTLPQDPVLVRRVERAVLALQGNPGVHERGQPLIAFTDRIRERHANGI